MNETTRGTLLSNFPIATWPSLDTSVLPTDDVETVERRIRAITMYAGGAPHAQIEAATAVSRFEIARLLKRCTAFAEDGRVQGFRALAYYKPVSKYQRTAPVLHEKGSGSAGCAGALQQLLTRFPTVRQKVHQEFLRTRSQCKSQDVRIRIVDLHGKFIDWIKEEGVTTEEWPFNTSNEGEEALRRYCRDLVTQDPERGIAARCGEAAARRNRLGTGVQRTFPALRPFGAVQLDFHKIDAASTIAVENSFGVDVEAPLARWHIGLLIEERLELILGAVIALEITPSSDSVLETIECALKPTEQDEARAALAIGMGAKVFPNQMFQQLRGQCFSVLRMDNGWSNTAVDVINNVVDVVGCAVNFGPVRSWWGRDTIERVFGQMTRESLQRSPSTYGANAQDTRRKSPDAAAGRLHIRLSDLVRALERVIARHNSTRTEALSMSSPEAALLAAMNNPRSLFVPARVPTALQDGSSVLYKTVHVCVRGNLKSGERPFVKIGRWRYTNTRLAQDYSLIGKELKAYCSIRDARIVYVTLMETGENLGRLLPPRRWMNTLISFRERALFFRSGVVQRRQEHRDQGLEWMPAPAAEHPSTGKTTAREALAMAKGEIELLRDGTDFAATAESVVRPEPAVTSPLNNRLFSLDRTIEINEIIIKE